MKNYIFRQSCRFFYSDRPCIYHKANSQKCEDCKNYIPITEKILIIKLGALGDVLRTTAICEPLKSLYPGSFIIWITEDSAIPVLSGNRFVDKIIGKSQAFGFVSLFNFDILINLDLDEYALILAGLTKAKEKKGFWFDPDRVIHFSSSSAEEYFTLSHDDFLKKRNKKTYQAFIAEIAGLPYYGKIIVPISSSSREYARNFAEKNGIIDKKIIGAIVGTGNRWITKRWPEKNFIKLFSLLKDFKIITFGGIEEKRLLEWIADKSGKNVISAGYSNTIDQFFGLLDLCDIVVCCDTFALHAAVGLGKKIVALFGPTSAAEIEMYDRGEKIVSDMSCVCCYKRVCEKSPNCMEMIDPEKVAQSVRRLAGEGRKNCSDNSHI